LNLPQRGYKVLDAVSPQKEPFMQKRIASIVAYAAIAGTIKAW
jgi:hypothetical protein